MSLCNFPVFAFPIIALPPLPSFPISFEIPDISIPNLVCPLD